MLIVALILFGTCDYSQAAYLHYFSCADCHKPGTTVTTLDGNGVCFPCHGSTPAPKLFNDGATHTSTGGFALGDASNFAGSYPATVTPDQQSSHNWASPNDVMPSVSALAPVNPKFASKASAGRISCSRCHNPHADRTTLGKKSLRLFDPLNPTKPAEEISNAMCLDCHRGMNKIPTHGLETHPLVADYSATVAAANAAYLLEHPTATAEELPYKPAPDNSTTANGNVTLLNGGIACVSCHSTHFADSDASTADGPSILPGTAQGDGLMLKHNGPRSENPAVPGAGDSICQTCHQYAGHAGATMVNPLGCNVCHGGHAFDPVSNQPNYYMLNKTIVIDSAKTPNPADGPGPVTINLSYTSLTSDWMNPAGTGYCQGCHDLGTEHNTLTEGNASTNCDGCHNHDGATFTGGGCNTCHGYSPSTDTVGGPTGFAADPNTGFNYKTAAGVVSPKNEATTAHLKHADLLDVSASNYKLACGECHNNFGTSHQNGSYQDVAFAAQASLGGLTPAAYAPAGNGTCATIYCHSDGRSIRAGGPTAKVIPAWAGGSTGCTSCHNTGTTGTSVVHNTHLSLAGLSVTCDTCHTLTSADGSTLKATATGNGGVHVDGIVTVDGAFNTFTPAAFNAPTGACAVYCHTNGTTYVVQPDWDDVSTGDCGDCHAVAAGNGLSGAHDQHLAVPGVTCTSCHTHDGLTFGGASGHINGSAAGEIIAGACNGCHGATVGGSGVDAEPVFTDPASVNCSTCHLGTLAVVGGKTAPAKNSADTTGHNKATGNYAVSGNGAANQACTACHDAASAGHFDGVSGDDDRLNGGFACTSCHTTIVSHRAQSCSTCHDPHGSSNIFMVKSTSALYSGTVVFAAVTGANSYDEADAANGDDICATCHTYSGGTLTAHNNKTNEGVAHNEGTNCFTCHKSHEEPAGAFIAGAGNACNDCHGNPPPSGVHAGHALVADNSTAEDRSDCATCHTGAASYTYDPSTDQGNSLNHGNAAGRVTLLTASVGFNSGDGSCATACHKSSAADGFWTDTALNCNACHYQSATPTAAANTADASPLTGTHNQHFDASAVCTDCHAAVSDLTHINDVSGATDALKISGKAAALQNEATVTAAALGATGTDPDPGNATCDNTACHNPSNGAFSATWTVTAADCTTCHSSTDPTTGSHTSHLAATVPTTFGKTVACSDCHGTLPVSNAHQNAAVDFAAGVAFDGVTTNTCNTTVCHTDGLGAAVVTPQWGRAASSADDCTICHLNGPATGRHAVHVANTTFVTACTECHTAQTAVTHIDDAVDNTVTYVPATGGCTNNCHTVTAATAGDWNDAAKLACTDCHSASGKTLYKGWPPVSGAHAVHVANSSYVSANCLDCHNDNTTTHSVINNVVTSAVGVKLTVNPANGSCTNSCHLSAQAADWTGGAAAITCTDCHTAGTYIGGGANLPTSGLHTVTPTITGQKHDQSVAGGCAACHNTVSGLASHINGALTADTMANLGLQYYTQTAANTGTCLTACHTTNSADWAHKWTNTANFYTSATLSCAGCHGDWNQTWNSGVIHRTSAASRSMHGTGTTYQCKDCHGLEATSNNYTFAFGSNDWGGTSEHGNGSIEVNTNTATYNATTGVCATCHTATGVDGVHNFLDTSWAIAPVAGDSINATCGSCHTGGKSTVGSSGAHDAHGSSLGDETTCYPCHGDNGGAGYDVYTGSHSTGTVDFVGITYSTATRNDVTGTCLTSGCHNKSTGTEQSALWSSAALACDDCHYYATGTTPTSAGNAAATTALSADHGNHFGTGGTFACAACHGADPTDTTHITAGTLFQRSTPVMDNATVTEASFVDGTNTCSNTACHNPSATTYSAIWQTSTASCTL
ncbi:MAG: hypothetical protein A2005_01680, partial [Desulfuromonadales bacterium GWC2_61_20]